MKVVVAPGIYRIEAPLDERRICVYALIGDRHIMLVDSGVDSTPQEYVLPFLKQVAGGSRTIDYVLTTHGDFDHMGGNASVREFFPHACFMAHRLDRRWIEDIDVLIQENYGQFDADHGTRQDAEVNRWIRAQARGTSIERELVGGEQIQLSSDWWVTIIHTPGHTRGHVSVVDPRSNAIIIADAALSDGLYTRRGKLLFPPTYRFVKEYLQSARTLRQLAPTTLLTSHYPLIEGAEVDRFLQKSLAFAARFQDGLLRVLKSAERPLSALQLTEELSPALGEWPGSANNFLLFPLLGHLECLELAGTVTHSRSSGVLVYQLSHE